MIAVILAAGMASRLRPLTDDRPKCLLQVGNRCLLQRTVDALVSAGIGELVVVTGYRGNMIRDFLNGHYRDVQFHFIDNPDYPTTNNIYSLWLTKSFVAGKDFILLDSDILFDPQIIKVMLAEKKTALALNRHELGEEEIKVIVDSDNCVTEISKVCEISKAVGESVGIEKMNADYSEALFAELAQMIEKEQQINIFYERAFERLIAQGHQFRIIDTTDYFSIELDTVEDFNKAKELIPQNLY
jgi:choline kinase